MKSFLYKYILIFAIFPSVFAQTKQDIWVDSVFNSLTIEQQIGQLFMVAAYSNRSETHYQDLDELISKYDIGGLIFFQGGPMREARLTNRYQAQAKVPLFMAIDGEWGLGMRLDSTMSFPHQMTLGAIKDKKLIKEMGAEIARQCKRVGLQINFAPVVDINVNPKNPVIGDRSFGENKEEVAERALMYMKGMQGEYVLANAKHFPGHGDTDADSHKALPIINHSVERIKEVELYPFRELFREGLMSLMVAHIHIPALDNRPNMATTLSHNVVTKLLKEEMQFQGLIFTDALNMKGVSKYYKPGEVDLLAFLAGNDVLLFAENVPVALAKIKEAVNKGEVTKSDLEDRVKRILKAKYWAGLSNYKPIELDNLNIDINNEYAKTLNQELFQSAITLVNNEDKALPFNDSDKIASVEIGVKSKTTFQEHFSLYKKATLFQVSKEEVVPYKTLLELAKYDKVIVGIHGMSRYGKFGVTNATKNFINQLSAKTKVVLVVYGNPYSLKYFQGQKNILVTYEDNKYTQIGVAQALVGVSTVNGSLPVSSGKFEAGTGEVLKKSKDSFTLSSPHKEGLNDQILANIDTIVNHAIESKAIPGAQVLVARGNKVIYSKAFGYLTYDKKEKVDLNTIYDIASITKVAVTTQVLMHFVGKGNIDINKTLGDYLPLTKGTDKENMTLNDVMHHQAGLKSWIPFWREFVNKRGQLDIKFFSRVKTKEFNVQVSKTLYTKPSVKDSILTWIVESPLQPIDSKTGRYPYVYSDLGYYLIQQILELNTGKRLDVLADEIIYRPLGLKNTLFNPSGTTGNIAPTENDRFFRKELVKGYVHDPGSAMLGGVAGHAGLFTNSFELAKIMKMNLDNGSYEEGSILNDTIVHYFTNSLLPDNRRGIGWDKADPAGGGGTAESASLATYGHSGFTGTCVWVDPEYDLIYVFLSNRVNPSASNSKLIRTDVRTRIHNEVYKALLFNSKVNFFK